MQQGRNISRSPYEGVCSMTVGVLNVVSLMAQLAILAIAPVNFCVILRTSVVHPNLKLILVVQAAIIGIGALIETVSSGLKIARQDPLMLDPPLLAALRSFCMGMMLMLGHVLLLERMLATVIAHRYEQWRSPWFSVGWFSFLATINILLALRYYTGYTDQRLMITWTTILFDSLLLLASFTEIIAITKLGLYNHRKYAQSVFYRNAKRTLSERYQLSENVRTLLQLGPILALHFLQVLGVITFTVECFFYPGQPYIITLLAGSLCSVVYVLANLGIVITVIGFHPALRNKALLLRYRICRFVFGSAAGCATVAPSNGPSQQPSDDESRGNGYSLRPLGEATVNAEMEAHFQVLEKCWAMPELTINRK